MSREIKTLESIVADVRYETRRTANRNFGIDEYSSIKYLIQREQRRLWWDHDWSFLRVRKDLTLAAGDRYYDIPAGISLERITSFRVQYGSEWLNLEKGITMDDYALYDSDADVRSDPQMKWAPIKVGADQQIEVWPMPAATGTCRLTGIGELDTFISDDDMCTLDATLLTLFAAAKLKPDEESLLAAANRLYEKQKGHLARATPNNNISLAGGAPYNTHPGRKVVIVPPA